MNAGQVLQTFREAGAMLEGHFIYTSGRHGSHFFQAARVLQYPDKTERLCRAMAKRFADEQIELVVGPATGGIILAYETARALGCRAVFTEKEADGSMAVRRGFHLEPGLRCLVVEDVITTGGSVHKTVAHLRERGANVLGVAVLIDRSGGEAAFDCRYEPLARVDVESWDPAACALCKRGAPLVEPDELRG